MGRVLDKTLVAEFAVNRAGADAFGPFVTLLGLIYSILLAQSYEYYFTRQGTIQDALYEEVMSLQQLYEAITALTERHPSLAAERGRLLGVLRTHSDGLLRLGFSDDTKLLSRSSLELHRLLETIEATTAGRSRHNLLLAGNAVGALSAARARRISAVAARLPLIQSFALRIIAVVLLLGFLLVDLGSPRLEALLFSVVSGVFVLINYFLSDLSDPFGGSWNVEPAREELSTLLTRLEGEGDGTLPQPVPTDEDGAPAFDRSIRSSASSRVGVASAQLSSHEVRASRPPRMERRLALRLGYSTKSLHPHLLRIAVIVGVRRCALGTQRVLSQ